MNARPILFSGPMVRALLEGRKTQTRRAMKWPSGYEPDHAAVQRLQDRGEWAQKSPYGQPGDLLWVRETWANIALNGYTPVYLYRADSEQLPPRDARAADSTWRPSIHMPREASRLTLKIIEVRVERLQQITEGDVIQEGCPKEVLYGTGWYRDLWNELNGARSWAANPWVWVLTFTVEKRGVDELLRSAAA